MYPVELKPPGKEVAMVFLLVVERDLEEGKKFLSYR